MAALVPPRAIIIAIVWGGLVQMRAVRFEFLLFRSLSGQQDRVYPTL
jgi:hypothetical protein